MQHGARPAKINGRVEIVYPSVYASASVAGYTARVETMRRGMAIFGDWCEVSPIGDLLVRAARLHPERDAIVLPGERHTYGDLLDGAAHVARGLLALGVRRGDHVGVLAPNGIEIVEAIFGVALVGGVVVPLNARHKAAELGYIVENGDLVALLTTAADDQRVDFSEVFRSALPSLAEAPDPTHLELSEAPRLRSAALLRGEGKRGFLDRSKFDELAAGIELELVDTARRHVRMR